MNAFYPSDQQHLFTNRVKELAELEHYLEKLSSAPAEHLALFGLCRIGKTLLLKEFLRRVLASRSDVIPVYMDFSALCSSPENFASGFVGSLCYWLVEKGDREAEPYLNALSLPFAMARAGAADLLDAVQPILHELERAKPDRQALLRQAFHFPSQAATIRKCRFLLIFDEFQEIRTLQNFPNAHNVLALFRAEMQTQSGILYILAGSAVSVLSNMLSNPDTPLFAQFTRLPVGSFARPDTRILVDKILSEPLEEDMYPLIHSLSGGHPFYITAISRRLSTLVEAVKRPASADTIKQAFLFETLSPSGRIYDFCRYVYDLSLQKASGYGSLKAVLQLLAAEEGQTASQVARRLKVSSASASDYLRWLLAVDLLVEKEHLYYFQDPVLRFWVAAVIQGVEVSLSASPLDLQGLISRLDTQFQRLSEELGSAQESAVRELLRAFNGQTLEGGWFGLPGGGLQLPVVVEVQPQRSPNGQTELDAVARSAAGETWIVEVKWRSKRAGQKEVQQLHHRALALNAQAWLVSRAGFTSYAAHYAAANHLFISDENDLQRIRACLKTN